ncbi:MAG TPA: hypothetical protein VFS20_22900 [Longimicrobium sp.]|nr:hypothetical protein [Longimicrobium sp.]
MDDAPAATDTAVKADTTKAANTPTLAPAPPNAPAAAAPDTCVLNRALAAWSDSSLAAGLYGNFLTAQFALREVAPASARAGASAAPVDTARTNPACRAARERNLDQFLGAYREATPGTVLTRDFVGKLTEIGRLLAASDTANRNDPASRDTTSVDARPAVQVPWEWLAALLALVVAAGVAVGYVLRRLARSLREAERHRSEIEHRQVKQLGEIQSVCGQIHRSAVIREDLGTVQQQTVAEIQNHFGRVRTEMAMLRESLANRTGGGSGTASTRSGEPWLDGDDGESTLVLDADPYGNAEWEEATVDVRSADGGPTTIHADSMGVFTVRWVRDGAQARLSVDPSRALGAAFRDKLYAAFRCGGQPRGSGRYHTVHEAHCTWDPVTGQGRITRQGLVEEA